MNCSVPTHRAGMGSLADEDWLFQWKSQFEHRRIALPIDAIERARALMAPAVSRSRTGTIVLLDLGLDSDDADRLSHDERNYLLDMFCRLCSETALQYDGLVVCYSGSRALLVFGAPVSFQSDAIHAASSALDILRSFDRSGLTANLRGGIATGPFLFRTIEAGGIRQYSLVGAPVDSSIRLAHSAAPRQIRVCKKTAKVLESSFLLGPLPTDMLWGDDVIARARTLLRKRESPASTRKMDQRFVGRTEELSQLRLAVSRHSALNPSYICITGEGGIGKSRLVLELSRQMAGEQPFHFFEGDSHGRKVLFHPLIAWMRKCLNLSERPSAESIQTAIFRYFKNHPILDSHYELLMGYLLGEPQAVSNFRDEKARLLRDNVFLMFMNLVHIEGGNQIPVLVFDDSHWYDRLTRQWIAWLLTDAPVRFPIIRIKRIAREIGESVELDTVSRPSKSLRLGPLDNTSIRQLLRRILKTNHCTEQMLSHFLNLAEGSPFYALEIAQSFLWTANGNGEESDPTTFLTDIVDNSAFKTNENQDTHLPLPLSILAIIQWRLDRLSSESQEILERGAIIGIRFSESDLGAWGVGWAHRLHFTELVRNGLLIEQPGASDKEFRFAHSLVREIVYGRIPPMRRREAHGRFGAWLEKKDTIRDAEYCQVLAHHWLSSNDAIQAIKWLVVGAENSHLIGELDQALEYCWQGLDLWLKFTEPSPGEPRTPLRSILIEPVTDLLIRAGRITTVLGGYAKALALFDKAWALVMETNHSAKRTEITLWRGICLMYSGRLEECQEFLMDAEQRARVSRVFRLYVQSLNAQGLLALQKDDRKQALRHFCHVTELGFKHKNRLWLADALNNIGLILEKEEQFPEALAIWQAALPHRRAMKDRAGLAITLLNIGNIEQRLSQYDQALRYYGHAEALAAPIGHRQCLAAIHAGRSNLLRLMEQYEDAVFEARRGGRLSREMNDHRMECYNENNQAQALTALGRPEEALTHARHARQLIRKHGGDKTARLSAMLTMIEIQYAQLIEMSNDKKADRFRRLLERMNTEAAIHGADSNIRSRIQRLFSIGKKQSGSSYVPLKREKGNVELKNEVEAVLRLIDSKH